MQASVLQGEHGCYSSAGTLIWLTYYLWLDSDVCVGELLDMLCSYVGESPVEQINSTGTVLCRAVLKVDYSDCPVIRGLAKSEILDFWL